MARGKSVSVRQFVTSAMRVTVAFLALTAGLLIVPSLESARREGQFATDGVLVNGTVLQVADRTSRGRAGEATVRAITYRYEVGGQAYQVEVIATSETARALQMGDPIQVRYLPNDTAVATLFWKTKPSLALGSKCKLG